MERKALIRQYKERRPEMGVFQIRNIVNGKILIGSSTDLPSMLNRQEAQLRLGAHPNRELQTDWHTFGADAFTFATLDTLSRPEDLAYDPAADLAALLAIWLEKLEPYNVRGYNRPPRTA
jgi:hypothetical protein